MTELIEANEEALVSQLHVMLVCDDGSASALCYAGLVHELPDLVEAQPGALYEARNEELRGMGVDLDLGKAASVKSKAGHAEISIDMDMFNALGPILGEHSGELDAYNRKLDEHSEPFIHRMAAIATISFAGSEAGLQDEWADPHDEKIDLTANFRDTEADLAEEAEILAPSNDDNAATPCRSEAAIAVEPGSLTEQKEYVKRLQAKIASLPASYEAIIAADPTLSKAYIADICAAFEGEAARCLSELEVNNATYLAKVEADKADAPALCDAYFADIDATKEAEVARCHAKLEADNAAVLAGSKAGVASSNADMGAFLANLCAQVLANIGSKADVASVDAKAEAGPVSSCAGVPAWSVADLAAERDNVAAHSEIFEQMQASSAAICARSEADLAAHQDERDEQAQADLNEEVERYLHSNAYNAAAQARREADLAAHHGHIADQGERDEQAQADLNEEHERDERSVLLNQAHFDLAEEVQPNLHSNADNAAVHDRSEADLADHQDHAYHQDGRAEQSEFPQQGQAAKGSIFGWNTAQVAAFNSNMESCYATVPPLRKVNHASDCDDIKDQREFLTQEQADIAAIPADFASWAKDLVANDFHAQVEATNAAVLARRAADLAAERDIKAQQCKLLKHALAGTDARLATQQAKVQADNAAIPAWSEAHVASFHANMEAIRAADRAQRSNVLNHREAGCSAFGDTVFRTIGNKRSYGF
eukprot:gene31528-6712_t